MGKGDPGRRDGAWGWAYAQEIGWPVWLGFTSKGKSIPLSELDEPRPPVRHHLPVTPTSHICGLGKGAGNGEPGRDLF